VPKIQHRQKSFVAKNLPKTPCKNLLKIPQKLPKNPQKSFITNQKSFMNKNLDELFGDQFIKINGVVMSGITKCPGMFGKNLEDMSKQELIDCIHFMYNRMNKLQDDFHDIEKQYAELMLLIKPILTNI
jgi:hypothetical protein